MLEVTGPDALRHALTSGIGHARAYGFGLLTPAQPLTVGGDRRWARWVRSADDVSRFAL